MEIKAELIKPYTEDERMGFIVTNNHQLGYEIKEVETGLQAWGYTEEELAEQEKERIAKLFLTGADVERGIYQAKGLDFDDIIALVEKQAPDKVKPLKIELKANNFYRGNPYVEEVGKLLGFTSKQLDMFFETNDYKELLYEDTTDTTEPTIKQDEVPKEGV